MCLAETHLTPDEQNFEVAVYNYMIDSADGDGENEVANEIKYVLNDNYWPQVQIYETCWVCL